jgi:hypothetical protein
MGEANWFLIGYKRERYVTKIVGYVYDGGDGCEMFFKNF